MALFVALGDDEFLWAVSIRHMA